jgi:hypothetical protein
MILREMKSVPRQKAERDKAHQGSIFSSDPTNFERAEEGDESWEHVTRSDSEQDT